MPGAYNRTLTPFGFQSEERTLWQAPETYSKMSPFMCVGLRGQEWGRTGAMRLVLIQILMMLHNNTPVSCAEAGALCETWMEAPVGTQFSFTI